ncbi:MAG: hypothetical protein KF795_14590 [Labilithrix sp.]|nr:hypothetical protein [Labilithrix sp.]
MTRRLLFVIAALGSASMAALSSGCSADDRPTTTGGGAIAPPTGGGADRDGASPDPSGDGGADGLCDPAAITVDGEGIAETIVRSNTPPDPLGGPIAAGTYVLTDVSRFAAGTGGPNDEDGGLGTGTPDSNKLTSKSIVVAGNTYLIGERTGTVGGALSPTPTLTGGTFAIDGTSVTMTDTCPKASEKKIGFTAVGATLSLYWTKDRRETYLRQ